MNVAKLTAQLMKEEGLRLHPYTDTVGKLTIGYGRNLTDNGITEVEAVDMLRHDIETVVDELPKKIPLFLAIDEVRQRVLADMAFNMGIPTLLSFKQTLHYIQIKNFDMAAKEMEDSLWYKQVGTRAARLCTMMRTGRDI